MATSQHQQLPQAINTDLDKVLTGPASPTTEHSAQEAQRAMSRTDSWKPAFNRRQSWNQEEHKHAQHMSKIDAVKEEPGFSERD